MWQQDIGDNEASTMYVPFGYSIDLFRDDGFGGDMYTVHGPLFEDENFYMPCIDLHDIFEDTMSSARIYKNNTYHTL